MSRNCLSFALALVLVAAFALEASAQRPPVVIKPAETAVTPVRARDLLGSKVLISGGTGVGTVHDIVFSNEGVVDYLVVSDAGKLVTVPWDVARFDFTKRVITVPVTREVYTKIPRYSVDRYPTFYRPEYRTEIYRYYGVRPGSVRRLERRLERRP